jgi:EF-P beta-lysylation protein EpmB
MIAATPCTSQHESRTSVPRWQQLLAEAIRTPEQLCEILGLDPAAISTAAHTSFPLRVPRGYVARMRRGDPRDPLLLQVLPGAAETEIVRGYTTDPVGDLASRAATGLLHKYEGRALIVSTGACAVHCRYCFRRHFPYSEESALQQGWSRALARLRIDTSIGEVILSGGDPLSLSDRRLADLTRELEKLPHFRRLRLHTRYPVVLPERIDAGLLRWLSDLRAQKVVVIHANHAQEIDRHVGQACAALRAAGATVLNQSVLLAGVNDSVDALANLSEALFSIQVLPYYLHMLDKVQGAAHFEVREARARMLHRQLVQCLPGYLVPKLVRETRGEAAKSPVT